MNPKKKTTTPKRRRAGAAQSAAKRARPVPSTSAKSKRTSPGAVAQAEYYKRKLETHTKVCAWVPNGGVAAFKKTIARLQKKWVRG